jgi:hypothetical protein
MRRSTRIDAVAIRDAARDAGSRTGVDVVDAYVKDVIVPAEIRTAAMQLVTAKARGAAQLEAARAETAALRALANAGKLLDAHPALRSCGWSSRSRTARVSCWPWVAPIPKAAPDWD